MILYSTRCTAGMKSPQEPFHNLETDRLDTVSTPDPTTEPDFDQELAATERSLQALKDRYQQVQQDQQTQSQLQQRQAEITALSPAAMTPDLTAELKQIQKQLDELEIRLESQLFSLSSFKEPFWQVVRFGGLGIVIGWGLALAVFNQPQPTPPPSVNPGSVSPRP